MRPIHPAAFASALVVALLACGDAVTDPAREDFAADPRPIEGDWATVFVEGDGDVEVLSAELLPAGGRFLGTFDFIRFGRFWHLQFNDGTWDGVRLAFTASERVNDVVVDIEWEAVFMPAREDRPAMLLLSSEPTGGSELPVQYLRPGDLDVEP